MKSNYWVHANGFMHLWGECVLHYSKENEGRMEGYFKGRKFGGRTFCIFRVFWSFTRKFMLLKILNLQNAKAFSREIMDIFQNAKVFSP